MCNSIAPWKLMQTSYFLLNDTMNALFSMKQTFCSFSFGCRVNIAEKIQIHKELMQLGWIQSENHPMVYIINSCAVTAKAEREVRQHIYQVRKKFPKTKIIVTGCAATLWLKQKNIPNGADYLLENAKKPAVVSFIRQLFNPSSVYQCVNTVTYASQQGEYCHDKFVASGRYVVKIQDGCSRYCSYCIVPYLRGKPTTRTITEIMSEIQAHEKHIQEVILTAINTEYFGIGSNETLTKLISSIMKKTIVPRISLGSIHPWSINSAFIEWFKKTSQKKRLVCYLHIPIQSGSDIVLQRMHRGYTSRDIMRKLQDLYASNPYTLFGTDIIVGFPGETEKEFRQTYEWLKNSPIQKFHIFRFSKRFGTEAEQLERHCGEISYAEKRKRGDTLTKLGKRKYNSFLRTHIGKTFPALILISGNNSFREALLDNQIPVWVKNSHMQSGIISDVYITSEKNGQLFGVLIN